MGRKFAACEFTRSVTPTSTGIGIDGTANNGASWIMVDVVSDHHYYGISEAGSNVAWIQNVTTQNNTSDGWHAYQSSASAAMQYQMYNVTSKNNGGWGFYFQGPATTTGISTGDFVKLTTSGNTSGGAFFTGGLAEIRMFGCNLSGDTGDELKLDS